jgi:hypothetical protein
MRDRTVRRGIIRRHAAQHSECDASRYRSALTGVTIDLAIQVFGNVVG